MCHSALDDVSSTAWLSAMVCVTFEIAEAKSRSAGASNTGLPPRMTSVWTVPPFIAETTEARELKLGSAASFVS